MVKGLSRRVIVVKAPDEKVFEQAIFIIREDFAATAGVSEKELLRQARRAANDYLGSSGCRVGGGLLRRLRPPLYAAAGAAATAAAWFALHLSGV
ncbi:MAG: translation initiation factor 2 [Ruminococcaceae bacterium]|nr:translation initiation factor 2 [Oscillospiraceae bacterium]